MPRHRPGHPAVAPRRVRILLVSQMYPGPDAPDLGTFVAELEAGLEARGHELARAVVDRRGGRSRHAALARDVVTTARRFRPDVVYAHFLVPAGLLAVLAGGRAGRPHGARPGRRERGPVASRARGHASRGPPGGGGSSRSRAGSASRLESVAPEARGTRGGDRLRRRSRPLLAGRPGRGARAARLEPRRDGVRLRRLAHRAEERPAPRARIRAARGGDARLRRRRAAARRARGPAGRPPRRRRAARRDAALAPRPRTSSASRASSSRSGSRRSRRWRAAARSSPRTWAARPSSSRRRPACSSTPRTRRRSPPRSRRPRRCPRPNLAARAAAERHDVRRQVERIEALLERAAGAPAAADAPGDGLLGGGRRAARGVEVVAQVRVPFDDDAVDDPAEDRADRRDDQVDPDVVELRPDEGGAEAPGRVDRRAADRDDRDVDGDERERDRERGRSARTCRSSSRRRMTRDEQRGHHDLDDDRRPSCPTPAWSSPRPRRR